MKSYEYLEELKKQKKYIFTSGMLVSAAISTDNNEYRVIGLVLAIIAFVYYNNVMLKKTAKYESQLKFSDHLFNDKQ